MGDDPLRVDRHHGRVDGVEQLGLEAESGLGSPARGHVFGMDHHEVGRHVHVGDGQPLGLADRGHREIDLAAHRPGGDEVLAELGEEPRVVPVQGARAASELVGDVALGEPVGGVVVVDEHEVLGLSPPRVGGDGQALVLGSEALAAVLELLARAPALGGVDGDPHEALELSLGLAHADDAAVGSEGAPVLAAQRDLALELSAVSDFAAHLGRGLVPSLRPDQVAQRPAEGLRGRAAV